MCANVEIGGKKGWTKLRTIKKPTTSKNTKNLTPASLGLAGKKLTMDQLVNSVVTAVERSAIDPIMKDYIKDAVDKFTQQPIEIDQELIDQIKQLQAKESV